MKKYTILAAVILFMFAACENEIRYKDEHVSPKLIINSLINIDKENNAIYLFYTGKTELGKVKDGTVEVTVNGELKETCQPEINPYTKEIHRYIMKSRFEPGDVVRIDAHTQNGKYHAWAEEVVPQYPILTSIDTMATMFKEDGYFYNSYKQLKFKIGIRDIPNEKNHYRIRMEHTFDVKGRMREIKDTLLTITGEHMWPWDDIVLTDGNPVTSEELENGFMERIRNKYGVFKDNRFANSDYTMTVSSQYSMPLFYPETSGIPNYIWDNFIPESMNIYTTVNLQSITESQYYYMNALNSVGSDFYEPFIYDPIAIPSNVNGGTGIVGFCSETKSEKISIIKDYQFFYGQE